MPSKINRAIQFCIEAHAGQKRRESDLPYHIHPIRVAMNLQKDGYKKSIVIAALLHDVVEDTDFTIDDIRTRFGEKVASLVAEVTDDVELKATMTKVDYWEKTWNEMSNDAKIIKFYDRLDNIQDRPNPQYLRKTLYALAKIKTNMSITALFAYNKLCNKVARAIYKYD